LALIDLGLPQHRLVETEVSFLAASLVVLARSARRRTGQGGPFDPDRARLPSAAAS
jgi:hypothetical protein